jgi:hypothetical protein
MSTHCTDGYSIVTPWVFFVLDNCFNLARQPDGFARAYCYSVFADYRIIGRCLSRDWPRCLSPGLPDFEQVSCPDIYGGVIALEQMLHK